MSDVINQSDAIVISGMSGKVPNGNNLAEFKRQIYNREDMITNCKRFQRAMCCPERYGSLPIIDKFDNAFFSIPNNQIDLMDAAGRIMMEVVCEALWDAGIHLDELKGARVGIYAGHCHNEDEPKYFLHQYQDRQQIIGMSKILLIDKISYFLGIEGPKYNIDSACSSSMFAMEHAFKSLESGKVDYAIVCGFSLILSPHLNSQLFRLGVLSCNGTSKPFDCEADGYCRSDSIQALILQRASCARRHYAEIVGIQTNCDGNKEYGITFPSAEIQEMLFEELYTTKQVPADKIGFMEAHGTGTIVGDPVELSAIVNFFCANRKNPLLIGSVKSNLGHAEAASAINSIIKCAWILESGKIAPNINYSKPNPKCEYLLNGQLQVVTSVMDLPEDKPYAAVNNFGFGGTNGHVLMKKPLNIRNSVEVEDTWLLCITGRTNASVMTFYSTVKSQPYDPDFIALVNSGLGKKTEQLNCRGYCIVDKAGVTPIEYAEFKETPFPLKCVFQSKGMAGLVPSLIKYKRFQEHIQQANEIFVKQNIKNPFYQNDKFMQNGIAESVVVTIVVQTGIIELIKMITPDVSGYMGSGIGEFSAAYADGVLSLEQIIVIGHQIMNLLTADTKNINTNILVKEIDNVCTMKQRPKIWELQKQVTQHENLAQYFRQVIFSAYMPKIDKQNILIIGDSTTHSANTIILSDLKPGYSFLNAIGRLHLLAYNIDVNKIYSIQWPVKVQTPMISPLVKWEHKKSWRYTLPWGTIEQKHYFVNDYNSPDWQSIYGHNIDGRVLFPATGYLSLAWQCLSKDYQGPIKFENVCFHRVCIITPEQDLELIIQFCEVNGRFEIMEKDFIVASGYINKLMNFDMEWHDLSPLPLPKPEEVLERRDVYKEFRLRGYYYNGQFKEIHSCNIDATVAQVKWTEWCPFLDNILQVKLLSNDTRNLHIPTKIHQIIIHPEKHLDIILSSGDMCDCLMSVYNYKDLNIIRCGFIEIRGFETTNIAKRKQPTPLLENNRFVPYVAQLDLANAARVMVQIVVENSHDTKVKTIEDFNDVTSELQPMLPCIQKAFSDHPLIQLDFTLYAKKEVNLTQISTAPKAIPKDSSNLIVIGYNLSKNKQACTALLGALKDGGFLISRESMQTESEWSNMNIICEYTTSTERIVMLQLATKIVIPFPIHITEEGFSWIETLKTARSNKETILIYSENEPKNGLMGLTNCLIKESGGEKVMNVMIDDLKAPKFDVNNKFYQMQLNKKLTFNVLKNGVWGSYRHLWIDPNLSVETTHSYANNTIRGDLSSLTWMQGPLSMPEYFKGNDLETLHIYISALNFKHVLYASGKITVDSIVKDRLQQENCLGLECAGRKENGERVMAIWPAGMISNIICVDPTTMWPIPDHWTMTEAATVPWVYLTNIYGLIKRAKLREGDSILIHSATGGIGLSAINIAIHYKCKIFLTVGTPEKKEYILKNYPSIEPNHIGNSRNTSFYRLIKKQTNGRGVDVILNSLADEKLQASVRCLAVGGRFVEIGKFDCTQDSPLRLELADREAEYHGVELDQLLLYNKIHILESIGKILQDGIYQGYIKPIPHSLFHRDQLELAFKLMTTGSHTGKILIDLRDEESDKKAIPVVLKCIAKPRFYCNPKGTYIILGGLGGFGLELADLLVLRGARRIVLVSRRGITTGYQQFRIKTWKSYDCEVKISTDDCTTLKGCMNLLQRAQEIGDVMGIYNLAIVLRDAGFQNQTKQTFLGSYNPKAQATIYLDQLTRKMCPKLEQFVVFSSVTCGRGNAGQTNYGYSNSVMERVCENRKNSGLPGKAIQWGIVGEVGIVAERKEQNVKVVFGRTLPQHISSCLEVMDVLLASEDAIVSSMVLAERENDGKTDIASIICNLMQIKDIKTVSPHTTFSELGMDSIMAVEIKQTLERDFDLFLSSHELRNMNLARVTELTSVKLSLT